MGYRSDVYIKMDIELKEEFIELCESIEFEPDCVAEDDEYFYAKYEYIKWYPQYSEVMSIITWINNDESKYNRGAIVIGEDNDVNYFGEPEEVSMCEVTSIDGHIIA